MSNSKTYFVQGCPTCGRRLEIRVEHLGKNVVCQHCRGRFQAADPSTNRYPGLLAPSDEMLRRADELLRTVEGLSQSRVS